MSKLEQLLAVMALGLLGWALILYVIALGVGRWM
jgi:hypothetical protein